MTKNNKDEIIVPSQTVDLIDFLDKTYVDKFVIDEKEVGTPAYWKHAGVIELIRWLKGALEEV